MDELTKYLSQNFNLQPSFNQLINNYKIPLYLQGNYELFESELLGHRVIWAKIRDKFDLSPEQLQKQNLQLKQLLHAPIIFVFEKLESWHRKRLIEKNVGFVQPYKQLYVPDLLLQFNDISRNQKLAEKQVDKLTPPAQLAILYHLQVGSLENKLFREIANRLNYSAMTVTRLVKELENYQLVTIEGLKEKSIKFSDLGRELWEKSFSLMTSPVLEIWLTDHFVQDFHFRKAGDTALATYTMIGESSQPTFAIGKEEFRSLKTLGTLHQLDKKNGTVKIEVWTYNPVILSNKQDADKLSVYLSLQNAEDERVQAERQELLNQISWLQD